jgi:hypothetical protein
VSALNAGNRVRDLGRQQSVNHTDIDAAAVICKEAANSWSRRNEVRWTFAKCQDVSKVDELGRAPEVHHRITGIAIHGQPDQFGNAFGSR